MPVGVVITTSLRTGPTNPEGPDSSSWFVGGITDRGPISGSIPAVNNITQYEQVWGPRTDVAAILYDQAMTFFAEGGGSLYVARAVGAAATPATLTLKDTLDADTVKLNAANPGTWGSTVFVTVATGSSAGTVTVTLTCGAVVEAYAEKATVADLVASMSVSKLVVASNLGSSSAGAAALPAVLASTALVGGDDDHSTVVAADVTAALSRFGIDYGPGAVSCPGYSSDLVGSAIGQHCQIYGRIGVLAGTLGADDATLIAAAASLGANGEYLGLFAPWVIIPDGAATRTISPEGYIAGVRARAFSVDDAFWQVPAGLRALARFVTGTYRTIALAEVNQLAAGRVSAIMTKRGQVYLYEYSSLSTNVTQWELLSSRDTVNAITAQLSTVLEPYVWNVIDGKGQLESQVESAMIGVLQPISDQGGLYAEFDSDGNQIHPGYTVEATSTQDQLGKNTIAATVQVKLSPFAALILIQLVKASFTAPLV
jgi:hypothetical protein